MFRRNLMSLVTALALIAGVVIGFTVDSNAGGVQLVDVAFIATGENYPDALAASAATEDKGPVLLVTRDSIPGPTQNELVRLNPTRIVVVGGTAVISAQVETDLGAFTTGNVTRLAGANRYETAADISAATFPITGAASCPGRAFMPDSASSAGNYGSISGARVNEGSGATFSCPLIVPDGVTVTSVQFTLYDTAFDTAGEGRVECELHRVDLTGGFENFFLGKVDTMAAGATLDVSTPGIEEVLDTSISFPVIDNSRFAYWVSCDLSSGTQDVGIYGVTVRYRN